MSEESTTDEQGATIRVEVVYALPDRVYRVDLELAVGSTVATALAAVGGCEPFSGLDLAAAPVGIFGEGVAAERVLADHDRVEIYRPLLLDPVEARRQRSRTQASAGPGGRMPAST